MGRREYFCTLFLMTALIFGMVTSSATAAERIRIVFPAPPSTLTLPFMVAQEKGYFEGIDVEEIYVSGDANAIRALISNNADIMVCGVSTTLLSIQNGSKLKVISSWQPKLDFNFILGKDSGDRVEDMAGKVYATTGAGNVVDVVGRAMFAAHGVDPDSVRYLTVTGGHAGMFQTVAAGRADAAFVNTVTAVQGEQNGQVKIAGRAAEKFPNFGYINNVVLEDSLQNEELKAAYQIIVTAGIRASRFIMENPEEAAQIMHEKVPDLAEDYLVEVIKQLNDQDVWGVDGGIRKNEVAETIKAFKDVNLIQSELPVSQVYDFQFVDAALSQLGAQ